jgi:hypothetical protein
LKSEILDSGIGFDGVITSKSKIMESAFYGEWIGTFDNGSESHIEFLNIAKEIVRIL